MIHEAWHTPVMDTPMHCITQKIKACKVHLLKWNQVQVHATPRLIADKKARLQELEEHDPDFYDGHEVNTLRRELNVLIEKEEVFWNQRSRVSWLKEGDQNTKFFHKSANQRKRTNTIVGLFDSNHVWKSTQGEIANIVTECFQHMFTSSSPSEIAEVVQLVDKVVMPELNADLLLPFSPDEVKTALFQMHPSKAPGPDGMTALFFQKYWHIVGRDVINAVLDFLQQGRMFGCVNFTNIVLIPKVQAYDNMSQF